MRALPASLMPVAVLDEQRRAHGLRAMLFDGLCSQVMGTFTTGVFLVGYALALGAEPADVGLLAAIPFLVNVTQLPALALIERWRRRKAIVVLANLLGRLALFAAVAAPALPDARHRVTLLVAVVAVHGLCNGIGGAAWNAWMRDLVPEEQFGRYFARRAALATALGAAAALLGGVALERLAGDASRAWVHAALFGVGALAGLAGLHFLAIAPEPMMVPVERSRSVWALLARPLRDPAFRPLVAFLALWNFTANLVAPFFAAYVLERLRLGMSWLVAANVVSQLANLSALPLAGRIADRLGNRALASVSAPAFALGAVALTALAQPALAPAAPALLLALHALLGAATAGISVATGNLPLRLAPRGDAAGYLALAGLTSSLAAAVGPLAGGRVATALEGRELQVLLRWASPGQAAEVSVYALGPWELLFAGALVPALAALRVLRVVPEGQPVREREVLRALALEARHTIHNLSSVAGLRGATLVPMEILRRATGRNATVNGVSEAAGAQ